MTMTIRRLLAGTALAAGLALPAYADETINVTIVNGHPPIFLWVKHLHDTFIPAVDAALEGSGYAINWTEAYGGTLAAVGGELDAIEDGLAEVAAVPTVFLPNKLPLQNVTYNTPFGPSDPTMIMSAMETLNQSIPGMLDSWHAYDAEPGSDPLRKVPNRSFWAATVSSLLPGLMVLGYAYQLSLKPSPGGWIDLSGLVIVALGMLGLGMLMFTPVVGALAALGARTGHQRKGRVGGVLGAGLGGGSALPIGLLVLYLAILSH